MAELPLEFFGAGKTGMRKDQETLSCLRSVLMKPEHRKWIDRIWAILSEATDEVLKG